MRGRTIILATVVNHLEETVYSLSVDCMAMFDQQRMVSIYNMAGG